MSFTRALCQFGHVASRQQLLRMGASQRDIDSALSAQFIRRIARGVYACAHLDAERVSAGAARCLLDCVSVLHRHGVWCGVDTPRSLHLRAEPRHHLGHLPQGAVVHWARRTGDMPLPGEVGPVDALVQAMHCLTPADALASVESALHLGFLGEDELVELLTSAPQRMRATLKRLDRGAQSGFETHTRLLLIAAGHRVRTQVPVDGTSPLDLLVDECVGVETDGRQWHDERFLADRTKDIVVEGHGIRALRIGRPHIFESWPRTLATIERMVGDCLR